MPAITYNDFSGGLDRRLPVNVQEANRLWVLRNAYITLGRRIAKRPGLRKINSGLAGSFGLESVSGKLAVFIKEGVTFTPPEGMVSYALSQPAGYDPGELTGVSYADVFNGFPYVVATYTDTFLSGSGERSILSRYVHHYVDGSPSTIITDGNCPRAPSVCKAASRVFAINGETVRYCAAGNPRDWTTVSDAGFLPAALQQNTKADATGVGAFGNSLVVFFPEGAQIWTVAVDPSANALAKRIDGVGCLQPGSIVPFANDLMFLSPYGFRSMTVQAQTDRVDDTDVGVAVDKLVVPDSVSVLTKPVLGVWIHQLGQYWAVFNIDGAAKVWAYTYSRSSKVACWSEYKFPVEIDAITTNAGKVYLRSGASLYEFIAEQYTDDGTSVPVEVQMAFQNAKTPGVDKQFYGADFVFSGSANVSYKYDPRDQAKETGSQLVNGDTAPGQFVPVEVVSPSIAPVFRHEANEAFELAQLSLYYNDLAVT